MTHSSPGHTDRGPAPASGGASPEPAPEQRSDSQPDQVRALPGKRRKLRIEEFGTIIFFLLFFVVITSIAGDAFLSWTNISGVLANNANVVFLATAVTLTLIAGQFDLSAGALAGMTSILMAHFALNLQYNLLLSVVLVLLIGLGAGLFNGILVVFLEVSPFIATLGTGSMFLGVSLGVSDGRTIFGILPPELASAGTHQLASIPLPVIYVVVLAVVTWALTRRTVTGRYLYAAGSNPVAALLAGVPVRKMTIIAFAGTGVLGALAGVVALGRFGSADPAAGPDLLLPAFAAAFLGTAILSDGRFSMVGSIVATYLIVLATNGLDVVGAGLAAKPVFNGLVLVGAIALSKRLGTFNRGRRGAEALRG